MHRLSVVFATALLFSSPVFTTADQSTATSQPAAPAPPARFELTVDSIMRGPDLVGYAPTGLRWSADSQKLYFEWRKPGEHEPSTYVVDRAGGEPRKLSDEESKSVPPAANGRWDAAHRRVLFVDDGDIVLVDAAAGTRRQITRTTGAESNPRWTHGDTQITYVRDGNLFGVSLDAASPALVAQLTDVGPKKAEPKVTDSQKFIRDEEEELIGFLKEQKEDKKRADEKDKKNKLPALELQDSQSAIDLMLSPDNTHVFVIVAERPAGAKNAIVPDYVTETGYTEDIQGRTNVGDTQDRRLLAMLNLQTGKTAWAEPASRRRWPRRKSRAPSRARRRRRSATSAGRCRWFQTTARSRWPACGRRTTRIAGS